MELNKKYNWKNYVIKADSLVKSKIRIDKFGNKIIPLKIANLIKPYATIEINTKYVYEQKNKNYVGIGINQDISYLMWDKEGILANRKIPGSLLDPYLQNMVNEAKKIKLREQNIYQQNYNTLSQINNKK
ncbi:hypothetical protein [Spiroplasma sp. DGKH1]|uniref:hypothetical protein n=1 Tax=Spiroplasma sp. DGKH1 TaxID=3050074 RepID=UPI0034C61989